MLENLVLESMQALSGSIPIRYWRDKQKHEIDFVVPINAKNILVIECKSRVREFSTKNLSRFRMVYTHGENWVVTLDSTDSLRQNYDPGMTVRCLGLKEFFWAFSEISKQYMKVGKLSR